MGVLSRFLNDDGKDVHQPRPKNGSRAQVISKWKWHQPYDEARHWVEAFAKGYFAGPDADIVVAPSLICLENIASYQPCAISQFTVQSNTDTPNVIIDYCPVEIQNKIDCLERKVEDVEQEKTLQQEAWERQEAELRRELERLRARLDDKQSAASEARGEVEKLRVQVELLEGRIAEYTKDEVDFKVTLVAVQRFADDMRQKAREEVDAMLARAIEAVETFRKEAEQELASLLLEIDKLQRQKMKVRDDLKAVVLSYFEQLDIPLGGSAPDNKDDLSEQFQFIPPGGDGEIG